MSKTFSKNDVTVLKANLIDEDQLNTITGGATADDKAKCTCDCWIGNRNEVKK